MKPLVIAFGLAMASQHALANTGSINFFGQISSGTCSIEIIDPSTGLPTSRIFMGNVNAASSRKRMTRLQTAPSACALHPGAAAYCCPVPMPA